jgi:hypothetical protein
MQNEEACGRSPGASLRQRYITKVEVKLIHKVLPRNAFRNALETAVL